MNRLPFRSAIVALALCSLSASAEPNVFVRVRSFKDFETAATSLTGAFGQPLVGAMAVAQIRVGAAEFGELREDAPAFFAAHIEKDADGDVSEEPTEALLAVPFASVDLKAVAKEIDFEWDEDAGRWTDDDGSILEFRDGYLLVAQDEATLASAGTILARPPRIASALLELRIEDPSFWSGVSDEFVDGLVDAFSDVAGLRASTENVRALLDALQSDAKDVERVTLDLSVDEDGTIALVNTTDVRAGSPVAKRIAAARPLNPALVARIPARSPFYIAASGPSPDQNLEAVATAVAPLFDGPAPSGNPVATAQREAFRALLAASVRAEAADRDQIGYMDFDPNGRFFFKGRTAYDPAAGAQAPGEALAALRDFVMSFPGAAEKGVLVAGGESAGNHSFALRFLPRKAVAAMGDDVEKPERLAAVLERLLGETFAVEDRYDAATGVALSWGGEEGVVEAAKKLGDAAPIGRLVNPADCLGLAGRAGRAPTDVVSAGAFSYVRLVKGVLPAVKDVAGEDFPEEAEQIFEALFDGLEEEGAPIRFASVRGNDSVSSVFTVPSNELRFFFNLITIGVERAIQADFPYSEDDLCIEECEDEDEDDEPDCALAPEETDEEDLEEDDGLNSLED